MLIFVKALVDRTNGQRVQHKEDAYNVYTFFNLLDNCSRLETHWRGHILNYLAYNRTESAFSIEQQLILAI